jgi:hypothetical protein
MSDNNNINIFDWIAVAQRRKIIRQQREQQELQEAQFELELAQATPEVRQQILYQREMVRQRRIEEEFRLRRIARWTIGTIVLVVVAFIALGNVGSQQHTAPAAVRASPAAAARPLPEPPIPPKGARP